MEKSKETYENIVIPEELAGKVQEAIDISRKKRVKRLTRSRSFLYTLKSKGN